jgi:hypothetical protein
MGKIGVGSGIQHLIDLFSVGEGVLSSGVKLPGQVFLISLLISPREFELLTTQRASHVEIAITLTAVPQETKLLSLATIFGT